MYLRLQLGVVDWRNVDFIQIEGTLLRPMVFPQDDHGRFRALRVGTGSIFSNSRAPSGASFFEEWSAEEINKRAG